MAQYPRIEATWIRGRDWEFMNFRKPLLYLGLGQKESGKSAFLETLGFHYGERGSKIIDLFGSRDNEGLAWCRGPFDNILFITGDNVDVDGSWNTQRVGDLRLSDFNRYNIVLSVSAFHSSVNAEFHAMNKMVEALYRRQFYKKTWFLMVREASNFLYSRLRITPNQTLAKADFLYLCREARHMGYAVGIDTIRWTGIDADARGVSDFVFVKSVGIEGLPHSLRWLYGLVRPRTIMNVHPRALVLVSRRGPVAFSTFDLPYWHKKAGENMLERIGIYPEYGDMPDYGEPNRNTVSDFEHIQIVAEYVRERSMNKVAKIMSRSPRTVHAHIKDHDDNIKTLGFCQRCKRVRGSFATAILVRNRKEPIYDEVGSLEELDALAVD